MAALSPRSANIPAKLEPHPRKGQLDAKVATLRALEREKDHPPPPPAIVKEPNTADGGEGEEYTMGRYLGKGGFAICYQGEARGKGQAEAGQLYALKIVKSAMPQPKLAEKFKTELQIHSKMFHPHIVEFHRAFTYGESTYIVLQLCSNGSLMDMVKQRKFLSEPEVRRYVIQISGAIKYLHHKNVIHRDLKMGNIFLDEQMNAKIGDFGLAALLLSQSEYSLNRRRTMCGTPNYIAPEVLAKGWKGHDHKVDIWSLGIIIFAMLSGYPPFQSKTQEEIYRKVKARSYLWPSTNSCANNISQEAKDLVASLLVDATERPEPDDLVCHAFFRSGVIPQVMNPLAKHAPPTFREWSPQTGVDEEAWRDRKWTNFCRKCGVGRNQMGHAFPAAGEELNKSTYKECLLEEKAGKFPVVPIPQHMIYKRFVDPNHWSIPNVVEMTQASLGIVSERTDDKILPTQSASNPPSQSLSRPVQPIIKRQEAKSHAAQLRERDVPKRRVREAPKTGLNSDADGKGLSYHKEDPNQAAAAAAAVAASTGPLNRNPVRSNSQARLAKASVEQPMPTRITRSQSNQGLGSRGIGAIDGRLNSAVANSASIKRREDVTGGSGAAAPARPTREIRKVSSYDQRRSKVVLSPVEETTEDEKPRTREPVAKPAAVITQVESDAKTPAPVGNLLIDPTEPAVFAPYTRARDVRIRLSATFDSLRTALNRRQPNRRIAVRRNSSLPLVTKWVDYSNKFGIGYTLSDGSMGCLLNGEANYPSSGVYVRGDIDLTPIITSSSKRGGPTGSKGDRPIPLHGRPVELYENYNERGFKSVVVTKEVYQFFIDGVKTTGVDDGTNAKKSLPQRELTPSDLRKRRAILLWGRFANYMRDSLAKSNGTADGGEARPSTEEQNDTAVKSADEIGHGLCVLFYQRLGNVGIWGFSDGGFQFNFPDHTKLVISQGATHIDFYHLPETAALKLWSTSSSLSPSDGSLPIRPISRQDLNDRGIISLSVRDIVCSSLSSVAKANQLEQKLTFVVSVLRNWLESGGLGMIEGAAEGRRIRWEGMSESVPSTTITTTTVGGNDKKVAGLEAASDDDHHHAEVDKERRKRMQMQQKKKRREPNGDVWVSIGALGGDFRYS